MPTPVIGDDTTGGGAFAGLFVGDVAGVVPNGAHAGMAVDHRCARPFADVEAGADAAVGAVGDHSDGVEFGDQVAAVAGEAGVVAVEAAGARRVLAVVGRDQRPDTPLVERLHQRQPPVQRRRVRQVERDGQPPVRMRGDDVVRGAGQREGGFRGDALPEPAHDLQCGAAVLWRIPDVDPDEPGTRGSVSKELSYVGSRLQRQATVLFPEHAPEGHAAKG